MNCAAFTGVNILAGLELKHSGETQLPTDFPHIQKSKADRHLQ